MVQLVKSTMDFEIFGAQPWHGQGEHRKFKSQSDFAYMPHFQALQLPFLGLWLFSRVPLLSLW
jgi:hypothetical protein